MVNTMLNKKARNALLDCLRVVSKAENKKPTAAQCEPAFVNLRETPIGEVPLHIVIRDACLEHLDHADHPALVKSVEVKANGKPSGISKKQAQHIAIACYGLWQKFRLMSEPALKSNHFLDHADDFVQWMAPATDDDDDDDDFGETVVEESTETPPVKTLVVEASGDFVPLSTVLSLSVEEDIVERAMEIITGDDNTQADGKFVRHVNGKVSSFNFVKSGNQRTAPTNKQHFVNRWMNRVGLNILNLYDSAGRVYTDDGKQKNETVWLSDCSAITDDLRFDAGLVACAVVVAAGIARHDMDLRGFLSPADRASLVSGFITDDITDAIADFTESKGVVRKCGFTYKMDEKVVRAKPTKASSRLQRLAGL